MKSIKVVGLGGSMKEGSASVRALQLALDGAAEGGAETSLLEIRQLDLPIYAPDLAPPAGVSRLMEAVAAADGLL